MFEFLKKKKEVQDIKCKCGHDIMLHGFSNMGCSVMIDGKKCTCPKFDKA